MVPTEDSSPASEAKRAIDLSYFVPTGWFSDLSNSSIWLRLYTCLFIPAKTFQAAVKDALREIHLDMPVALSYTQLEATKTAPWFHWFIHAGEDGLTTLKLDHGMRDLPRSIYVGICTPHRVDGKAARDLDTIGRLDLTASLIRVHLGLNFLKQVALDTEVNATGGDFAAPSDEFQLPSPTDGPFLAAINWSDIREIAQKLALIDETVRTRVTLAFRFFARALEREETFFNYWTAMEVLCGGTSQTIRDTLSRCYGLANVQAVDAQTGFKVVSGWRHKLIHQGIRPLLTIDVVRYLQLMFLDLLRHIVYLKPRCHALAMQQARGCDLRLLGLQDNRTPEQIEDLRRFFERQGQPYSDSEPTFF